MQPNCKHGKSANGKTFQAARSQREHTRTHDRAGGLRLSQNAVIDLLLQGQKGRHSGYQTRETSLHLSGRIRQMAGILPKESGSAEFRGRE